MKLRYLFIIIIFLIFLSSSLDVKAAEGEVYSADIAAGLRRYNDDGTTEWDNSKGGIYHLTSSEPMYGYYYRAYDAPTVGSQRGYWFVISKAPIYGYAEESVSVSVNGEAWYLIGLQIDFGGARCMIILEGVGFPINRTTNGNYYGNVRTLIADHIAGTVDIIIEIDWDNPVYNENIGYLQNVGLKITGAGGNDFTLTWSVFESNYLDNDWRVQIGYMTTFSEKLMGDQKAYTDLNLVSWKDELYYSVGRKEFKLTELWEKIPNAISYSHNGYFLLRLVHVDKETGLHEVGGWTQIHYMIDIDGSDTVTWANVLSSSILEHNGVTDNYEIIFEEDTTSGKGGFINSANGSIDSVGTNIQEFTKDWNLSEVGDYFTSGISSLSSSLSQFPSMVSEVASFLPPEIFVIIGISIVAIILCRFVGR